MAGTTCSYNGVRIPSLNLQNQHKIYHSVTTTISVRRRASISQKGQKGVVKCGRDLADFIGGDLVKFDLGQWLSDVEEHKALAIYTPHEGGYEGRYLNRLRYQGYHFLDLTARGLGDPETTLTKVHPVCPAHVGKQPIARWYFPPEVDYRLSLLPPNAKGLVVWIIEAKVLSKAELQFLALLPTLRPRVRVIAECGNWYTFSFILLSFIPLIQPYRNHMAYLGLVYFGAFAEKGFVEATPRDCRFTGMLMKEHDLTAQQPRQHSQMPENIIITCTIVSSQTHAAVSHRDVQT